MAGGDGTACGRLIGAGTGGGAGVVAGGAAGGGATIGSGTGFDEAVTLWAVSDATGGSGRGTAGTGRAQGGTSWRIAAQPDTARKKAASARSFTGRPARRAE